MNSSGAPLRVAAKAGDLDRVRSLLAAGMDFNAANPCGETPLTLAAAEGHLSVVQCLLAAGADVHAKNDSGNSALHLGAVSRQFRKELVEVLLAAGADVNARNLDGETPLLLAARSSPGDTLQRMLDAGADVLAHDRRGNNVLHHACWCGRANQKYKWYSGWG